MFFAGVITGALFTPAAAQTQAALAAPPGEIPPPLSLSIRRLVPEVQMVIAAQDHHGRPVLNLEARQIKVLDNGVTAPLTSLQPAASLHLRIGLVVDASASMRPGFAAEHRTALALLRQLRRSCCGECFLMAFAAGESPEGASQNAFPGEPGGQTALYDTLIAASTRLASTTPARRVLLLLSDGEDTYSRSTLAQAIAALQAGNIAVYAVTVHSPRLEYPGDRVLRQIAAATGGRAFLLSSYEHASRIVPTIENQISAQYLLGFRPVGTLVQSEFHSVRIVALRHGVVIHARPGYFVSPAD